MQSIISMLLVTQFFVSFSLMAQDCFSPDETINEEVHVCKQLSTDPVLEIVCRAAKDKEYLTRAAIDSKSIGDVGFETLLRVTKAHACFMTAKGLGYLIKTRFNLIQTRDFSSVGELKEILRDHSSKVLVIQVQFGGSQEVEGGFDGHHLVLVSGLNEKYFVFQSFVDNPGLRGFSLEKYLEDRYSKHNLILTQKEFLDYVDQLELFEKTYRKPWTLVTRQLYQKILHFPVDVSKMDAPVPGKDAYSAPHVHIEVFL